MYLSFVVLIEGGVGQLLSAPILRPVGLLLPIGIPLLLEVTLEHPLTALQHSIGSSTVRSKFSLERILYDINVSTNVPKESAGISSVG